MTVQPYLISVNLGEKQSENNNSDTNRAWRSYRDPEFTKLISQELLEELQRTESLEDGLWMIHKALEFIKSNRIHHHSTIPEVNSSLSDFGCCYLWFNLLYVNRLPWSARDHRNYHVNHYADSFNQGPLYSRQSLRIWSDCLVLALCWCGLVRLVYFCIHSLNGDRFQEMKKPVSSRLF